MFLNLFYSFTLISYYLVILAGKSNNLPNSTSLSDALYKRRGSNFQQAYVFSPLRFNYFIYRYNSPMEGTINLKRFKGTE